MYIKFSFFLLFLLFSSSSVYAMPAFVSTKWLSENYSNPHLVIVDVRKSELYNKGHIKHAVNVPVFKDLFDTHNNYTMPKLDFLQKLFSNTGIDKDAKVVVYGNNQLIWAARFYWLSKVLGHDEVALLKVGYGNWKEGQFPISKISYKPKPKIFIPRMNNKIIETKLTTALAIGKDLIIDGRPLDYYKGHSSHAKRFGHIKSALNYPGSNNYDANGSGMKNFSQLKSLYKDLPKDKKIILYCEDGADAALNFMVLQELGYKASVYDGSWLEWGNDSNLPIEK